jgi:hypothetical protein
MACVCVRQGSYISDDAKSGAACRNNRVLMWCFLLLLSNAGRARSGAELVDLNAIFGPLGGGGHLKAAAANIKMDPGRWPGGEAQLMDEVMVNPLCTFTGY